MVYDCDGVLRPDVDGSKYNILRDAWREKEDGDLIIFHVSEEVQS